VSLPDGALMNGSGETTLSARHVRNVSNNLETQPEQRVSLIGRLRVRLAT
jgi:hypothetical protein